MTFFAALRSVFPSDSAKKCVVVFCLAVIAIFLCQPLYSQTNQGSIQGAVLDQSGGAIVGATVTVTDTARGTTRALSTDSAGVYVATNLTPGSYTVRAEAKGFETVEHAGVLVEVSQNLRLDLTLQPGSQTQTVTVTGEVPEIDTTDATLGGAVSNQAINSLPLNGRNFERLLQLRPGVVSLPGTATGSGESTNGRRTEEEIVLLDGIVGIPASSGASILNTSYRGGDSSSLVPIDAIQEFSVQENPKAEYGWRDGSTTNVGVKSGTNTLHGTAYAFGRDAQATDAANAFSKVVTPANLEQFGATAGGPILKDKLFWFAGYEGLRTYIGDNQPVTMPTSTAGAGVGTSIVDTCNSLGVGKINPLSAILAGLPTTTSGGVTTVTGCSVLVNGIQSVQPASSTVENVFPYVTSAAPYTPALVSVGPLNNGIFKADYSLGTHNHISGLIFISHSNQSTIGANVVLPQWATLVTNDARQYSGNWAWTPTSNLVNEFRMGYVRMANITFMGDSNHFAGNPWPAGYSMPTGVTNPLSGGFPDVTITAFTGTLGSPSSGGSRDPEGDLDITDSVSYLRGKHAFKFGAEFLYMVDGGYSVRGANGAVTFTNLQNFLTGTPLNGSILLGAPPSQNQEGRDHMFAPYVQDDWRINPRITLNLGLRWEYIGPPWETQNNLGNFNPNVTPATTPAVQQAGPGAPLPSIVHPDYRDFSPRVGAAWDVRGNGKTVVRASFSILRSPAQMATLFPPSNPFGASFPSIGVNNSTTQAGSLTSVTIPVAANQFAWNTTGPVFPQQNNLVVPAGTAGEVAGTYAGLTCTPAGLFGPGPCPVTAIPLNFRQPYSADWNFDLQRAISNNFTVDVAYVGDHGYDEVGLANINSPAIGAGWDASAIAACLASAPAYGNCKPDKTAEVGPYSALFPYISQIPTATNGDHTNYNALQLTAQGRAFHGLSFISGYALSYARGTVARSSAGSSNPVASNMSNLSLNYGYTPNDVRNRFTFAPTYDVPGKKLPGQMLEGWTVSGIVTLQSAFPWTAYDATTEDWLGTGNNVSAQVQGGTFQYWNYMGPKSAFNDTGATPIPCYGAVKGCAAFTPDILAACQSAAQAPYAGNNQLMQLALAALANSNGACYTQKGGYLTPPAFGTLGNAGNGFFRGTPYYNVDFSISKNWKFRERYSAQFRAEFFNLFNFADYGAQGLSPTKPSTFGFSQATPDSANPVLGSGGPRHIQFGLKLAF